MSDSKNLVTRIAERFGVDSRKFYETLKATAFKQRDGSAPSDEQMMALLVEKNPNALAGAYELLEGADPEVSMRIKMGQTSDVVALVKADGKFYLARKEVKVTLGGCGG